MLLDMDETLLHAATLEDIYENHYYGENAEPSFFTQFTDDGVCMEIGVFLRPYVNELIKSLHTVFDICIYTASERVYADAILDQIDPKRKIFHTRLYRDKCRK